MKDGWETEKNPVHMMTETCAHTTTITHTHTQAPLSMFISQSRTAKSHPHKFEADATDATLGPLRSVESPRNRVPHLRTADSWSAFQVVLCTEAKR